MHSTRSRTNTTAWRASSPTPDTSAIVDVWHVGLVRTEAELAVLGRCLHAEEQHRAARFHAHRERCRFRAARGFLRHILSTYVDTAPERIRFDYGAQGKPFLPDNPEVHFNLSHSGDALVIGVARDRRVGIDVEQLIPERVVTEVLETVSSEPERALLDSTLPVSVRGARFAQLWTRKEAYIKADGRGMAVDLKRVDVLSMSSRVRLLSEECSRWMPCPDWTVQDLVVGPGLVAAVVAEGSDWMPAHHEGSVADR